MPNQFIPNTTGGRAGQFTYNDLTQSDQYQGVSVAGTSNVIPPGNPSAPYKTSADYEAEDQQKVDNYVIPIKATDEYALSRLTILNNKKQEIVDIMTTTFASINSIGVDYPTGAEILVSDTASVSDSTAEKVTYMAGISTFIYPDGCVPTAATSPACTPAFDCCLVGVRGEVYPDIIGVWQYPNVESLSTGDAFWKEGESYVKLTSSNLGIGVTGYEFGNVAGNTDFIGLVTTSNSSLGYYYFWPDLSAVNAGAATSISNLVSDIESLRTEINDYYVGVDTGTNKLRSLKSLNQLNLWYEKKGQSEQSGEIYNYQSGIEMLDGNVQTIQDYNS